jgi:branched-subunit amino acid ABC-type transport system permease component
VLAVTALVGVVLEFVVFRPMRRGGSPMINLLIVTIGISILLQNVARLAWGSEPLRYPRVFGTRPFVFGEVVVASYVPWVLVFGVAVMVALQLFFARTPTGIAMRASAQDPLAARLMGVSVDRMITYTFAISAALGGAGGVLIAPVFFASFNMGEIGLKAFVAATIGGLGSMPGAMLGGVVLGLVETFSAFWVSSEYRDAIAYGILILVLLFLPSGILGGRAQQD